MAAEFGTGLLWLSSPALLTASSNVEPINAVKLGPVHTKQLPTPIVQRVWKAKPTGLADSTLLSAFVPAALQNRSNGENPREHATKAASNKKASLASMYRPI
tara:strand:- start:455 stop:760 length:306 start_codon:yes stop_codon:yes gene_type:complete